MNILLQLKLFSLLALIAASITAPISSLAQSFTWPTNTAENVNMDQQYIDAAISQIESGTVGNIRSLIVIKDGQ